MMKKTELGIIARTEIEPKPFGKQTFYFDDMLIESNNLPIDVFIFSPMDWVENQLETKMYFKENGQWKTKKRKMPIIIYDRFTVKRKLERNKINNLRNFLIEKKFNFTIGYDLIELLKNKLNFHKFLELNNIPTIDGVLIKNITENEIKNYFNYNNTIYIKPLNGSRGRNISILTKNKNKYTFFINTDKFVVQRDKIIEFLKTNFANNLFFVQAKAKIFELNNALFDIRVLIQNKGNKNYILTGMAVRKGKKNSWISNLDAGGKGMRLEEINSLLINELNKNYSQIEKEIQNICFKCTNSLHKIYGNFAEIAYDILLTKDKGAIIIEANSKPARWIFNTIAFDLPETSELHKKFINIRKQSVKLPLIFAINNNF